MIRVGIFEYDEVRHMQQERAEHEARGIQIGQERGIQIGQERGIEQGREQGREEGMKETARNLCAMGMEEFQIARAANVSVERVREWIGNEGGRD